MMNGLKRRVEKLEQEAGMGFKPMCPVIRQPGETEDDMRARWEKETGSPVRDRELLIIELVPIEPGETHQP